MRILEFDVAGHKLRRKMGSDFTGLMAGSRGYLFARFCFSTDWLRYKKVAVFVGKGHHHPVPIINGVCEIPAVVLTGGPVKVYVVGDNGTSRICTDQIAFTVGGG